MRLNHVRLLVRDIDASARFYGEQLGLPTTWGEPGVGYMSFAGGSGADLSLFVRENQPEARFDGGADDRVLLVLDVEDVDAEVRRLGERGVEILREPRDERHWGLRCAYVRDPDGNLLEIMQPLPRDAWADELQQLDARYR